MTYNVVTDKISSFTQLRTWQHARQLAVFVYKATEQFPDAERFGLTAQLRHSSVSVAANIAEGFSRSTSKDKTKFYNIALGSLTETTSHGYIAFDLGFLSEESLNSLLYDTGELHKMINGLMKSATGRNT